MITSKNFFSITFNGGDVAYDDDENKYQNTSIYTHAPDGTSFVIGEYSGDLPLVNEISYEDWHGAAIRPNLTKTLTELITATQKTALEELEGEGLVNQRKAIERINTLSTFEFYDELMDKKEFVRSVGNAAINALSALSADELNTYTFKIDMTERQPASVMLLTVGAFEARFTLTEFTAITEAKISSPSLAKSYASMINRTHIDLTSDELLNELNGLVTAGLISDTAEDPITYGTRLEELTRSGTNSERYRVIVS